MNLLKSPVSYSITNNSAIIWWESDSADSAGHGVNLTLTGSDPVFVAAVTDVLTDSANVRHAAHRVFLRNLPEDSLLSVNVVGPGFLSAQQYSFRTLGATSPVTIGVLNNPEGYFTSSYPQLQYVLDKIGPVDYYLSCGGITSRSAEPSYEDWADWYQAVYPSLSGCGMISAKSSYDTGLLADAMFPTHMPGKTYFAASVGCVRIVVLDTTETGRQQLAGGAQLDWAINQFNSHDWKQAKYRVILTSDPFRVSLWDQTASFGRGTGTDRYLLGTLYPLLRESGADLVLVGKGHSYQRGAIASSYPYNDSLTTNYIMCAGMAPAHTVRPWQWKPSDAPGFIVDTPDYHYVTISADSDRKSVV